MQLFVICDISINSLHYESNIIVKSFFNCLFLHLKIYFPTAIGKHCILNIIQMLLILNSQCSFVEEYNTGFPEIQKKVGKKTKKLSSPLVTKSIQKFWKKKQSVRKILEKRDLTILKRLL